MLIASEVAEPHIFEERLKCHVDSARYSFNDSYVDDNDDNRPIGITDRLQARHKTQYVDPADILNDSSIFSPHFAAIESPEGSVHGQLRGIDTLANGAAVDTYVERIFGRSYSLPAHLLQPVTHEQYADYPELARSPSPGIDGSVTKDEPTRPISPEPTDIHPSAPAKNDDLDTESKSLTRPKLKLFHTPESSAINAFDDPLHSSGDKLEQNYLGSHLSDASTLIPTFPQARRRCGPANNARSGVPNSSSVPVQEPNYDRPKTPTTSEIHHTDVFLQSPDNNYRFPTKQSDYSITLSPHRNSIYIMERRHCNHSIDKEISCFPDSLGSSRRSFGGESEPKERRWISRRVLDRGSASRRFSVDLDTLKGPATEADNARMDITPKAEVETQLESLKRRIAISFPAVANEVSKAGSLQIEHTPKTEPMIECKKDLSRIGWMNAN